MYGEALQESLHELVDHFYEKAVPPNGRYVDDLPLPMRQALYTPPRLRSRQGLF
jgi:hypothetical protein